MRLFDRQHRRISLTPAGELLLQYAQKMIDIEKEARSEITEQEEARGSLSIRIPETVSIHYLPRILRTFHERYPEVGLNFARCTFFGLEQELSSGIIDLAFLLADESFLVPSTETETLLTLPLVVAARADHPLAAQTSVDIQDLISEPILLPSEDCSYRIALERMLAGANVAPAVVLNFNSIEAIRRCVAAGVGVTLATEIAVREDVQAGRLSILPWTETRAEANLQMIWHESKWISPILQAFMQTVRESVSSLGPIFQASV